MSSAADIADSGTAVQASLTAAEASLAGEGGALPAWYLALRNDIHGLIRASAEAVGEDSGVAIMGLRCQPGQPHQPTCEAYRAAATEFEDVDLPTCPRCHQPVHALFADGVCHGCWTASRPG